MARTIRRGDADGVGRDDVERVFCGGSVWALK